LTLIQVTTRSPMGAIAHTTGGIVIDGWLRVLGGGGSRMHGDLARWNGLGDAPLLPALPGAFIVAIDVLGGVFALMAETRSVGYFAPDTLRWEDLGRGYSEWLQSMLVSNLDDFFAGLRWDGWRDEVASLELDRGLHVLPPLWSRESKERPLSRRAVPLRELVSLGFEIARQIDQNGELSRK
jgi:hypothetical protein